MGERKYSKHYEDSVLVEAEPSVVFKYADEFRNFSAHMSQSQMMMVGSRMHSESDEDQGKKLGSHIRMEGTIIGVRISLDEVITEHTPPRRKAWETEEVNLLVIDHYRLGFEITPYETQSKLKVFIDYDLPQSWRTKAIGILFGGIYARWCVRQMANDTRKHFNSTK